MTANTQLSLLQNALVQAGTDTATKFNIYTNPTNSSDNSVTVQNSMIIALNKIVWNTWVIGQNTRAIAGIGNGPGSTSDTYQGTFAQGGWITGGTPGRDSVPILAMQDEFMVNRNATRALTEQFGSGVMDTINSGRLPSNVSAPSNVVQFRGGGTGGNAEMLARIDRLTAEVVQLRKENNTGNVVIANTTLSSVAAQTEALGDKIEDGGKRVAREISVKRRDQRA